MTPLGDRFPSIAEAAGYLRQAVTLLNREGGIVLLFIAFLAVREVLRAVVGRVLQDDAVRGGVSLFLSALLAALFIAAAVLKVKAAAAGRGVRWVPALEAAAPMVFRIPRQDLAVVALLGGLMVGVPLVALATPLPGVAEVGLPGLAAMASLAGAAGLTAALLLRGWARRFPVLLLLLALLFVNYGTFLSIGLTQALSGPLIVQPALRAVEGVAVNVTADNQTLPVPIVFYCSTTSGASTPDLLRCLQANLPAGRFQSLSDSIGLNNLLILLLAHPSRGLAVVVPLFLLMSRLYLAFPAAVLEGGLGLRRSWALTRGRFRASFWLAALVLGGSALLAAGPGIWLLAAGAAFAALYAVRHLGYGRANLQRAPLFQAGLAVAGLGLALSVLQPLGLGPHLARLFGLAVGGTAFTLYYLNLTGPGDGAGSGGAPPKQAPQIPRAE